jgi:hypothetical protein
MLDMIRLDEVRLSETESEPNHLAFRYRDIEIRASVRVEGWTLYLEVLLDGHRVHSSQPTAADKEAWYQIDSRLYDMRSVSHDTAQSRLWNRILQTPEAYSASVEGTNRGAK